MASSASSTNGMKSGMSRSRPSSAAAITNSRGVARPVRNRTMTLCGVLTTSSLALAAALTAARPAPGQTAAPAWTCDRTPIVVANARRWTTGGIGPVRDVLIESGRIARVAASGALAVAGARVIDAGGAVMLPGLVDAHAHLDALPGAPGGPAVSRDEIVEAASRQTLASGVTTVRLHLSGLADTAAMAARGADSCTPAPRAIVGGPGLTGGAPDLDARLMRGVRGVDDGVAKVAAVHAAGATWIALHRLDLLAPGEQAAVVGAARQRGLRVMAAGDDFAELRAALAAGVDSIEYLNRTDAARYPDDALESLRRGRTRLTVVAPIGYYLQYHAYRTAAADVRRPALVSFYAPAAIGPVIEALAQHLRNAPPSAIDRAAATLGRKFQQVRSTGVPMALGSDSGSPAQFHVEAIWQEMRAWHALGARPDDILRAGTVVAARLLGDPRIGRLEPGDPADLLLYRGDVASGQFDRRHLDTVIKGGVIFVRGGRWVGPQRDVPSPEPRVPSPLVF
jgi:imidazolonepropionase-like amidohydrolase